ncbi:MAG TPA: cysteine desulfurase family protein [Vicinamibacterales bacterium]|jgi:cysteine desulfurase|nr:cysteine desulfurase family protein [Vicinamibacterales bacterium]
MPPPPRSPVYLDYHATTPVDPRVLDAMLPYFTERFGNPNSRQHAWGWEAEKAVDAARAQIAALINASASEIVFTGGATESNNLAIKGIVARLRDRGSRIVTAATEHKSVLDTCATLRGQGLDVRVVGVRRDGLIDLDALSDAVTTETILVSVMAANNEIGTLQPLAEIATIAHECGALLHTDAAQAAGKIPLDVRAMGIDLLSLTGHKIYGPKGCGALFVAKRKPKLLPVAQLDGGGQESGVRSGTLNVPGIVGLGAAAEICRLEMPQESARLSSLRDRLLDRLRGTLDGIRVNGSMERRLPHNLHVSFERVEGERLLMALGDLAVSTGSACSSGSQAPSHVLQAIDAVSDDAGASIRFGLGRSTTAADVDFAAERVIAVVSALRRSATAAS